MIKSAKELIKDFLGQISRKIEPQEDAIVNTFFQEKLNETIRRILDHPVSQELRSHIAPSPILGPGVKGSFFGFVGLPAGSKPVDLIISIIKRDTKIFRRKLLFGRGIAVSIIFPGWDQFRVPGLILPYEGGYSLPDALERGISGLQYYIKSSKSPPSRSREGIQVKNLVRNRSLGPIPYLSAILGKIQTETSATRL